MEKRKKLKKKICDGVHMKKPLQNTYLHSTERQQGEKRKDLFVFSAQIKCVCVCVNAVCDLLELQTVQARHLFK